MANESERMHILQMIEDRKITAAEGLRLLNALGGVKGQGGGAEQRGEARPSEPEASAAPAERSAPEPAPASPSIPDTSGWRNWWMIPLWIGLGIVVFGGALMYWAYRAGGFGLWFACTTLPFALGVVVAALAWASRSSRWIHIRVNTGEEDGGHRIALSFPLPIRLAAWGLRVAGPFIPKLKDTGVDELVLALEETTSPDNPLFVDVHEGEGGERVQVYIG
jgi:hypothetical protein